MLKSGPKIPGRTKGYHKQLNLFDTKGKLS